MIKKILTSLNIREEEQSRAWLLFMYNFLVVATFVQGRIVRDVLFLKRYDIKQLPLMYIFIALIISFLTYLYTKKSSYFRLDILINGVLFFSVLFTIVMIFLIDQNYAFAYPMLYVFIEITGAFMTFQFWGFANELLDSREAKRVLGFVGGGGVMASLITGFGVAKLVSYIHVEELLILNAVFMILIMIIVKNMGQVYKSKLQRSVIFKGARNIVKQHSPVKFFALPYVKYIAFITIFVMIVVTFNDYQFKIAAREYFGGDEQKLAQFFGVIYAVAGGLFSFFFQFFATSRLLKMSIFFSLSILPAMITGFSFLFLLFPAIWFITMSRASEFAFKYTINDSAMQLLYIPLDPKLRSRAKAMIDGIIKQLSIGFAGLLIYLITILKINPSVISILVVTMGILWLLVIYIVKKEYLFILIDNIKKKKLGNEDIGIKQQMIENIIIEAIGTDSEEEILMALDMIEKGQYYNMSKYFIPLLSRPSPKVRTKILRILRTIESRFFTYEIMKLMKDSNEDVVKEAVLTYGYMQMEKSIKYTGTFLENPSLKIQSSAIISLIKYGGISGVMISAPYLKELSESPISEKRSAAAYILGEIGQQNMQQQVFLLLSDSDAQVRREAVKAATKIGSTAIIPKLFFMLLDKNVSMDVYKALASHGDKILEPAQNILENSIDSYELKAEVAKMLGDIKSPKVIKLLLENLNNKSDELRNAILESLKRIVARTEFLSLDTAILQRYLFKEFYLYFQLAYYKDVLRAEVKLPHLSNVIETKQTSCFARIFSILSLMYGNNLFDTIFFNISQKYISKEQKSNAIELIDNIVDKDIRNVLLPMIESQNEADLLRQGFASFKIKMIKFHEILETFLMDDSDWVRAVALHLIAEEKILHMSNRVSMFMYDPSPLVRETALFAAYKLRVKINDDDLFFLLNDDSKNVVAYASYIVSCIKNKA